MHKGRDKFSAFCYFCNPKQRNMNIRERFGTLRPDWKRKTQVFNTKQEFYKRIDYFCTCWLTLWESKYHFVKTNLDHIL